MNYQVYWRILWKMNKVKIVRRDNWMYPYAIEWMGQPQVLLTTKELKGLYWKISDILVDDEELW